MKRAILALALLATPTSAAQIEDKTFYALQSCLSFAALDEIPGMLSPDLIRRRLEARCAREIGDSRRSGDDPSEDGQSEDEYAPGPSGLGGGSIL